MTDTKLRDDYFGYRATCTICSRTKKPVGRSAPVDSYMCEPFHEKINPSGCEGYDLEPLPSHLWPGESEADFGFKVPR